MIYIIVFTIVLQYFFYSHKIHDYKISKTLESNTNTQKLMHYQSICFLNIAMTHVEILHQSQALTLKLSDKIC